MFQGTNPCNMFSKERLEKLKLKALKYIDNQMHAGQGDDTLYSFYKIQPLALRWREHIGCIIYKLSHDDNLVDVQAKN